MYKAEEMPEMPGTLEPTYWGGTPEYAEGRKQMEVLLGEPRIYADLMKGGGGRYVLTSGGTDRDLRHYGIVLQDGMLLRFFDYDTENDPLLFEGQVYFDETNKYWVAFVDPDKIRHFSDTKQADTPL